MDSFLSMVNLKQSKENRMKIIIIRYKSGLKDAIPYDLKALDLLEEEFEYIEDIEIIEISKKAMNNTIDLLLEQGEQNET